MSYTVNPSLPKLRAKAAEMVRSGMKIREVARHFNYQPSTILRWCRKAPKVGRALVIPTLSSRPHHHPKELTRDIVKEIRTIRLRHHRCAEVVHQELLKQGIKVSLSTVKRTLDRQGLTKKKSPWKKWHFSLPRPYAEKPGDLVQMDTVHIMDPYGKRFYVYTLIDLASRWAWATVSRKITAGRTVAFLRDAQHHASFPFTMVQSDHGPEFSSWFTAHIPAEHRHSRVRKPNDNAHIERFNRTVQEEGFREIAKTPEAYQKALRVFLPYYNQERLHMALKFKTPSEVLRSY